MLTFAAVMRLLDNLSLRFWVFLCVVFWNIRLWAQDYDDNDDGYTPSRDIGGVDGIDMDAMADYQPINISATDVFMVALLIVACYVFGKIWKGCSYLLLVFAALMYYLIRF